MLHIVASKGRNFDAFRVHTDPSNADADFNLRVQSNPDLSIYRFDLPLYFEHGSMDAAQELADRFLLSINYDYSGLDILAEHHPASNVIHVVANEGHDGGGGWTWYADPDIADRDFADCVAQIGDDASIFRFDLEVKFDLGDEDRVTEFVEQVIDDVEFDYDRRAEDKLATLRRLMDHYDITLDETE